MSHEVESMAYHGLTPWHGLGVKIENKISASEALSVAGINWPVKMMPVYTSDGHGEFIELENYRSVSRLVNDHWESLAVMGLQYRPFQQHELAEWADAITEASGAHCEAAGSLLGGRRVWFLMRLGEDLQIGNDPSKVSPYFLLVNSHDGSLKLILKPTPIRTICWNTMNMALADHENEIQIRHTSGAKERLDRAIKATGKIKDWYSKFLDISTRMTKTVFTRKQYDTLVETLISQGKEVKDLPTKSKNQIEILKEKWITTPGKMPDTAYGAYQAIVDYVDHDKPSRGNSVSEARLISQTWGSGSELKQNALEIILESTREQWESMSPVLSQLCDDTKKPSIFEIAENSKW